MPDEEDKLGELEDLLCDYVRKWVRRVQPRLADDRADYAQLEIMLHQPQWDDDDTLILEARIEEKASVAEFTGRVTPPKEAP